MFEPSVFRGKSQGPRSISVLWSSNSCTVICATELWPTFKKRPVIASPNMECRPAPRRRLEHGVWKSSLDSSLTLGAITWADFR
jgi:hypothetical protein